LFRLLTPIERAVDALMPNEEDSRRRLLSNIRAPASALPLTLPQPAEFPSRPALIGVGLLAATTFVLFLVVAPARRPAMTANAVLIRAAEMEETPSLQAQPGVIFERVEVSTRGQRFEWAVYRDRQGKRTAQFHSVSQHEAALKNRLAMAGVARESPLSAASFKSWHDHSRGYSDSIVYSPSGLITVRTTVPASPLNQVQEETLTLRAADYHPLARAVTFRDAEVVEIAEVGYQVLDWGQARREWFEDATQPVPLPATRATLPAPITPPALTEPQLNLAELEARLVLSRQNADVNEQIELIRQPDGIVVRGLTSTAERKQQLQAALASVAHVTAKVSTVAEQDASVSKPTSIQSTSIKLVESVSLPSPLLVYLKSQHRSPEEFPQATWQMLDSALRISQQSHALRELAHESAARPPLDAQARQVYDALLRDHEEKLDAALADQARVLKVLAPALPASAFPGAAREVRSLSTADDLEQMASTSLRLCQELTAGKDSGQRDALSILSDVARESSMISVAADRLLIQNHR